MQEKCWRELQALSLISVMCFLCSEYTQAFTACAEILATFVPSEKEACFSDEILCQKIKTPLDEQIFFVLDAFFWMGKECVKYKSSEKRLFWISFSATIRNGLTVRMKLYT
jgi:hypothetical protein